MGMNNSNSMQQTYSGYTPNKLTKFINNSIS